MRFNIGQRPRATNRRRRGAADKGRTDRETWSRVTLSHEPGRRWAVNYCAPKLAALPCLSCQNRCKLGRPARDYVAFLDVQLATGSALEGIKIG